MAIGRGRRARGGPRRAVGRRRSRRRLDALARDGIALAEGQRLEVRPAVDGWAREVGRRLAAGLVLVIDYGAPAADLYGPRRRAGTLMTYRGHVADGDPGAPVPRHRRARHHRPRRHDGPRRGARGGRPRSPGRDVRRPSCSSAAGSRSWSSGGRRRSPSASEALELRSAVMRLLDPRHLGGFRAVLAGRGIAAEPPLRGLAYRMPRRPVAAGASRRPGGDAPARRGRPRSRSRCRSSPARMPAHVPRPPATLRARVSPELPAGSADQPVRSVVHRPQRGAMEGIWYVVGFAFAGVSFVFLTIGASWLISHRTKGSPLKGLPYESGIETYGDTHGRFGVSYYIYALLFVAFDIEVVFIFLWALVVRDPIPGRDRLDDDLRRDPAPRPGLRVAQGGADVALTRPPAGSPPRPTAPRPPAARRPARPAAACPSRPRPPRTRWPRRSSSRTRSGRPSTARPTAAFPSTRRRPSPSSATTSPARGAATTAAGAPSTWSPRRPTTSWT